MEEIKLVDQAAEFKLESKYAPLQVILPSLLKAVPKAIKGFDCQITSFAQLLLFILGQRATKGKSKSARLPYLTAKAVTLGRFSGSRSGAHHDTLHFFRA